MTNYTAEFDCEAVFTKLKSMLARGDIDSAGNLLVGLNTSRIEDPDIHMQFASLAEEAGTPSVQIRELNLAARNSSTPASLYLDLAGVFEDGGYGKKALKCLRKVIELDSSDAEAYRRLGALLVDNGSTQEAVEVYKLGAENTGDDAFQEMAACLSGIATTRSADEEIEMESVGRYVPVDSKEKNEPSEFSGEIGSHHLVRFHSLFAGREDVYARQWSSSTGKQGYTPVREPLTLKVLRDHIDGRITAGVYQLRLDSTVMFAVFDIDIAKFAVNQAISDERKWKKLNRAVLNVAKRFSDVAASYEIPAYIEDSGFKGMHLWVFFAEPVPANTAKIFAAMFAGRAGQLPPGISVETFPKQTYVRKGGFGNLIKLPLGFHRKSGRRCLFLEASGSPVENQLSHILEINEVTREKLHSCIRAWKADSMITSVSEEQGSSNARSGSGSVVSIDPELTPTELGAQRKTRVFTAVSDDEYSPETDDEVQTLLARCSVLRSIVDNVSVRGEISNEEKIVVTHSIGHLARGPEAVNHIFEKCVNVPASEYMKSQLRGNPVSCPKIRKYLKKQAAEAGCRCNFSEFNTYPSPVLHLQVSEALAAGATDPLGSVGFKNLVKDLIESRKRIRELRQRVVNYEHELSGYFESAGIEEAKTPFGRLIRKKDDAGKDVYILEL